MDIVSWYGTALRAAADPYGYFTAQAGGTVRSAMASAANLSHSATTAQTAGSQRTETGGSDELGKDAFLRLLITQLRYQDPINPVKDQEFIAQLAQFSALEQMNNMAVQMERLADAQLQLGGLGQAVALLGRTVVFLDPATGGTVTGRVEAVRMEDGQPQLVVGERRFLLSDVVEVRPEGTAK